VGPLFLGLRALPHGPEDPGDKKPTPWGSRGSSTATGFRKAGRGKQSNRWAESDLDRLRRKRGFTQRGRGSPQAREDVERIQQHCRQAVREEIVHRCGSARQAFRSLDQCQQGRVGVCTFSDFVDRLGVRWQHITGLRKFPDLFRLFDAKRDGYLDFEELFPEDHAAELEAQSRDEQFVQRWASTCPQFRGPRWSPADKREELSLLHQAVATTEEIAKGRQQMKDAIRNLKTSGTSNSRCREVVAVHLPRGTGPKDMHDVQFWSDAEAEACRRQYREQVNAPVRKIQREIHDMREQRKVLGNSLQDLRSVMEDGQLDKQPFMGRTQSLSLFANNGFYPRQSRVEFRDSDEGRGSTPGSRLRRASTVSRAFSGAGSTW
jgi:hypothetical protein